MNFNAIICIGLLLIAAVQAGGFVYVWIKTGQMPEGPKELSIIIGGLLTFLQRPEAKHENKDPENPGNGGVRSPNVPD